MEAVRAAVTSSPTRWPREFDHTISAGPVKTRAASRLDHVDDLLELAAKRAPARQPSSIDDLHVAVAFLATDCAQLINGGTVYDDGEYHIPG